jgi:hypothetical protein
MNFQKQPFDFEPFMGNSLNLRLQRKLKDAGEPQPFVEGFSSDTDT